MTGDRHRPRTGRARRAGMALVLAAAPLALSAVVATPAQAATVRYTPLADLLAMSEVVVVAEVTAQGTRLQPQPLQIHTETGFAVRQVLHGDKAQPFMVLDQLGGVVFEGTPQELRLTVPGYPTFEVGEQVVLFLERTPSGELVVAGLNQGKFTLRPDPKTGELMAERDLRDLNVVRAPREADARFAGVPPSLDRLPFSSLVALIEGRPLGVVPARIVRPATRQVTLPATEGGR